MINKLKPLEIESIKRNIPILGNKKGTWLLNKIKELQPKNILELGTANGYSGIILASEANLTTIEIDKKIAEEAKNNFNNFNLHPKIIIGDATKEILTLQD